MSRWDKFFLVLQRLSSVLVILAAGFLLTAGGWQWIEMRRYEQEMGTDDRASGARAVRKLPYVGQQIETAGGSLIAIFQEDGDTHERVEFGGVTMTNPATGKAIELAPNGASVIQFELIFEQGGGKAVGYIATVATPRQYQEGRMDLVVGALPAMTRNLAAGDIRYSDLPQVRGDGSVGVLMWPEEGEAYLVAIRLVDGTIIDRTKVTLPALKKNTLSQGPGERVLAFGGDASLNFAPVNRFSQW